ncbi:ankyrin repeat and SOCS box protein 14-like [Salvia hispanica]|uniref:ankyrin repeat and SOCS box protein 14-like n=1 Tax=Salvia hispanica TaxID=49212 RepID=UPI0020090186|nr:ankyrin repeat and SOCS box protein 14-like [Salvia hispanica]
MRSKASVRRSVDDSLFNDVHGGQPKPVYDKDILSMPVYDKPVYDEDIFYELPGLISESPPPYVIFDDTAEDEDVVVDDDDEYGKAGQGNHLQGEYRKICDEYSDFTTCWNVLHNVVEIGNFEICKFLITSLKVYIDEGDTPLVEAVKWERIKIPEFLLKQGAKFNPPNVEGFTPLHYAVIEDNMELKELLLEAGADQNLFFSGIIPLGVSAKGDEVDSRTSLFQEGEYDAVLEDKS